MRGIFRRGMAVLMMCMLMFSMTAAAEHEDPLIINPLSAPLSREETEQMVAEARKAFLQRQGLKEELASEIRVMHEVVPAYDYPTEEREFYVLSHKGMTMRFFMETIGKPDEKGLYPLYIALHGGGGGPEEINNDQWTDMQAYYRDAVENGIYVACRGITDTWDLHFQKESYPLYERLIEGMIMNYGADPNRVYLLGFSAGGDGVYQISPRLADRFAAVSMSSGHPNGVSLLNLANCPIILQAGIRDYYSEEAKRSVQAAAFDGTLNGFREKYGFGYEHEVFIHVPEGHNYVDNQDFRSTVLKDPAAFVARDAEGKLPGALLDVLEKRGMERDIGLLSYFYTGGDEAFDRGITETVTETLGLETRQANTNAVRWVSQYTREPAPERIVWDLSTRATMREKDCFYWLKADPSVDKGVITAFYDAETNTITVEPDENVNGDFAILFHPALIDVSRPVTIRTAKNERVLQIRPSAEYLKASMDENGDPELACVGEVLYSAICSPE